MGGTEREPLLAASDSGDATLEYQQGDWSESEDVSVDDPRVSKVAEDQLPILKTWWRLFRLGFPSAFHVNSIWLYINLISCCVASVCPTTLDWAVGKVTCAATNTCDNKDDNGRVSYYALACVLVCVVQPLYRGSM
ncbi:hypothetical protein KIPB_010244 [Kipferlia bialata]|uniref:Uncharacterized protein n=1 Tax=Kipferlia bialata TaxID=797122 RepID=A0A9K3D5G7_9EUKA|nr:hypothetical protein KIPB_010244 [Kipferlia bialata]|eukprot:g10244.t1